MRPRIIVAGLAAIIVVALIVLSLLDNFFVNLLWFGELGYRSVYVTMVLAQYAIFGIVWLAAFVPICISGLIAVRFSQERERLRVVRRPDDMVEINLPELIRALGERVPWQLIAIGAAAVLAIFVAQGEAVSWDIYLKGYHAVPFGRIEPAFGHDVGFYIFTLPLLEDWRDLFLLILVLATALTAGIYWVRGGLDFRESPPRISEAAGAHLSVLLAVFFLQRAFNYWLARFQLLLHGNGVVFGLRYVDHLLWKPGLWLLVALSIVAAAICLANLRAPTLKLPVIAAIVVFGPSIVLSLAQPAIESLWVKPDELRIETPYIKRNITMTRQAYRLDGFDVRPFLASGKLTLDSVNQDAATIKNIRLWDPRPLIATFRQLQEIRLYYNFLGVDIDRYWINGEYTQVMLAARELNADLLPANAQTWVNRHLKFTHGIGLVMSPVNRKDSEGLPLFYVSDIPPVSNAGFKIDRPQIYFGEADSGYAVVNAATPEFDYPRGAGNVFGYYHGDSGIPVAGFWRRLLFSYFFRDINLLVTENIIKPTRLMIRRNISDRVANLAPFLTQDRDPYMVVYNGGLVWILDTYTTSDHYPYSQSNGDQINYIRNPVKVVIDAYTGKTDFYVSDPDDPIIKTWERIFPSMFKPLAAMPPELRAHIRYPEDFFLIQSDIYRTYHMVDPDVFYNREDQWEFPRENYADETMQMQPYYVIMRLPGETKAEYMLMIPMVPRGRDNMIAWLAARCDGSDYGHLFEYAFSKEKLFFGPYQIQARINQNPDISRQYSLWNQMGSKVILGNLIVIPIQESLLYVEPLYIRAENGQLPELQRVIAAYSDRIVMGETLEQTLHALFEGSGGPAKVTQTAAPSAPPSVITTVTSSASPPNLQAASNHYNRALAALKGGNWAEFGAEMEALGRELGEPPGHR
ncbi:MAG TPA: UPF0182 family protein [Candidatus Binataceae bacterium]|nr:UPF0182 family protein [Candidatus Binataceae bacterium]